LRGRSGVSLMAADKVMQIENDYDKRSGCARGLP